MTTIEIVRRRLTSRLGVTIATTMIAALAPMSVVGQGAMAAPAGSSAAAASDASTTPKARVAVHLRFPDCTACRVRMQQVSGGAVWQTKSKRLQNHRVTFTVRHTHTVGSVFLVRAPGVTGLPYAPLIAMHYRGFEDGEAVSNQEARTAAQGTACWVGARGIAHLLVRTHRFATETTSGDPTTGIRAWTRHTKPKLGRYQPTDQGAVGTQDVVPCGNPR
jgi:hypothetical protein